MRGPCIDFVKALIYYISIYVIIMVTLGFAITRFFSLTSYYAAALTARGGDNIILIPGLLTALCVGLVVMIGEPVVVDTLRDYGVRLEMDYAALIIVLMLLENVIVVVCVGFTEWWMGRLW